MATPVSSPALVSSPFKGEDYLDLVAKTIAEIASKQGLKIYDPENRECGCWSLVGGCENGHRYAKKLYCGREWCELCRDQVQNRRIARWLPKVQQLDEMGYWVITFPEEVLPFLRQPRTLSKVGRKIARILRSEGFSRGLRRWHWFGDQDQDFRPHFNAIVEGKYLRGNRLGQVKDHIRKEVIPEAIRQMIGKDLVIHYSYTKSPGKMFHILRYVTRATFLDREWDPEMAKDLWNFRNSSWWGKWNGEAKWHTEHSEEAGVISALEQSICPKCGKPIKWASKPVDSTWLMIWGAKEIGQGYYELPEIRASPGGDIFCEI